MCTARLFHVHSILKDIRIDDFDQGQSYSVGLRLIKLRYTRLGKGWYDDTLRVEAQRKVSIILIRV